MFFLNLLFLFFGRKIASLCKTIWRGVHKWHKVSNTLWFLCKRSLLSVCVLAWLFVQLSPNTWITSQPDYIKLVLNMSATICLAYLLFDLGRRKIVCSLEVMEKSSKMLLNCVLQKQNHASVPRPSYGPGNQTLSSASCNLQAQEPFLPYFLNKFNNLFYTTFKHGKIIHFISLLVCFRNKRAPYIHGQTS